MDEKRTTANGDFTLDGEESELTNIDPQVNVYHDCNDGAKVKKFYSNFTVQDVVRFQDNLYYRAALST